MILTIKKASQYLRATTVALSLSVCFMGVPAGAEEPKDAPVKASNSLAGNYLAGRIAASDRDTENAVTFYRKALALDPDNNDLKLKAFLNFISNGDFDDGVTVGRDLVKAGQEPQITHIILAADDIRRKSWPSVERKLEKEWRSALDRLMANLILGWVKIGQDKPAEAIEIVEKLKGPAWFDLFAQYHGGLITLAAGDTKAAVKKLQTAFDNQAGGQAASETYVRVIAALAYAHFKDKNVEAARQVVLDGLKRQPQLPLFTKMLTDINKGDGPDFVITNAQRGAAEVYLNLGTALNKDGGQQFARIYMQLARALADKDDAVAVQLAELLDTQGLEKQANLLFETIQPESPYYRAARLDIALNLDQLGDLDAARAELDKLIASGPDDLITYLSYGAVLARHEKYDDAIVLYQRALDRIEKPETVHWNLYYRQGIAYERTKQWPLAEKAFRNALELFPDQPSVLNYLGYSWVDMGINLQEGLDMIRKAVSLRPNDGYMVDSLGWAFYRLKRFDEAVVQLERAVELRPGDPTINDHLGDAYWRAGRKLEATFQWNHALALDPPDGGAPRIEEKLAKGLDVVEQQELAQPKEEKPDNG